MLATNQFVEYAQHVTTFNFKKFIAIMVNLSTGYV